MASSVAYHCTGRTALRVADVCAVCVVISSHLLLCVQIAAQAERRSPLESPLEAAAFPFGGAASLAGVPPVSAALGAFYALTGAFLMLNFAGSILVPNLLLYAWAFPATATMTYALSRLGLPTLAASLVLTFVGASSFRFGAPRWPARHAVVGLVVPSRRSYDMCGGLSCVLGASGRYQKSAIIESPTTSTLCQAPANVLKAAPKLGPVGTLRTRLRLTRN